MTLANKPDLSMMIIECLVQGLMSMRVLCSNTGQSRSRAMDLARDWPTTPMGTIQVMQ